MDSRRPDGLYGSPRSGALRAALAARRCLRVIEVHSPLAALLAAQAQVLDAGGQTVTFDALWSSSLADASEHGLPDIEVLDLRSRLPNLAEILATTTLPLIVDGDTGGTPAHLALNLHALESAGAAALIIEDKEGLKQNSLLGPAVQQRQIASADFCDKLRAGKQAQMTDGFMLFARIESLILGAGLDDAWRRARDYVAAGADGILIHSRQASPQEIFAFAARFKADYPGVPLACVPTTYAATYCSELEQAGINLVIYANHLTRAAWRAMAQVAAAILRDDRSLEAEVQCISVAEMLQRFSLAPPKEQWR